MPTSHYAPIERCALCDAAEPLRRSHVIPDFIVEWLRIRSGGSFIERSDRLRRVQGGTAVEMLCDRCEQRMSVWEGKFRQTFMDESGFRPLPIEYDDHLLKFSVSLSFKALTYLKHSSVSPWITKNRTRRSSKPSLPKDAHTAAVEALQRWRQMLRGRQDNPGKFGQYLLASNLGNFRSERDDMVGFEGFSNMGVSGIVCFLGPLTFISIIRSFAPLPWKHMEIRPSGGIVDFGRVAMAAPITAWLDSFHHWASNPCGGFPPD